MEDNEIDIPSIIERILWGKSIAKVKSRNGDKMFILRSLSIKEANIAKYIREREYQDGVDAGLMTHDELLKLYIETDDWTPEHDIKMEALQGEVKQLEGSLARAEFMPHRKKSIAKQLNERKVKLAEMQDCKTNLFSNSAESRADEIQRRYIVMWSTETMDEKPYWPNEQSFLEEDDHDLIFNLAIAYFKNNIFSEKTLRKVSRSGAWRYRWKMAKGGADLFGKPVAEWSEMQNLIVYWSQVYDYVYESTDSPSEHVINNDALCDNWIDEQNRKAGGRSSDRDSKRNMFGTKKAKTDKTHQEEFIMVQPGDKESIKKVQEMNDPQTRERLRRERAIIEKKRRRVKEFELRKGVLPNGQRVPIKSREKR